MGLKCGQAQKQIRAVCMGILLLACCLRSGTKLLWHPGPEQALAYELLPFHMSRKESPSRWRPEYDRDLVRIDNRTGRDLVLEDLFEAPLDIPMGEGPCVLILHTHGTEAYADSTEYRSEDPDENVVGAGAELARLLNERGIPTLHDPTAYDQGDYNSAYLQAEAAIREHLERHPGICVIIDLHRDAVQEQDGSQRALRTDLKGEQAAKLLLVMGSHTEALPHPRWEENLAFAVKLQAYLEEGAPGLMRDLSLRSARYNEHLSPCSLLLEVGSAGNSREEALRAAEYFAQRLSELLLAYRRETD